MKAAPLQYVDTRDLIGNPKNPRKITTDDLNRLCDSIRQNGFWEHKPMAVERQAWTDKLVVLDGNQRLKALRRMKRRQAPVVVYSELTDEEREEIILRSNIENGTWDVEMLQVEFKQSDFEAIGLKIDLPEPPDVGTTNQSEVVRNEAKKRQKWGKDKDYTEPVCDLTDHTELHALRGYRYLHSFKAGSEGIPISEIKTEANVQLFAEKAEDLIRSVIGIKNQTNWAITTTPKRRHKEKNFASMVCEELSKRLSIPFYDDAIEAKNRMRVDPVFILKKDVKEDNLIIYDDILTGGTTLYTTANLFPDKNKLLIVGINNHR